MLTKDSIIEELHQIREEYLKKFNYNLDAVFEDILKKTIEAKQKGHQLVSFADKTI